MQVALDKQASSIVLFDVRKVCSYTDYIVLCSGESTPQLEAIQREMGKVSKEEGIRPRVEGSSESGWILLDLGEVIVHVFFPAEREYYQLDALWSEAETLVKIQ